MIGGERMTVRQRLLGVVAVAATLLVAGCGGGSGGGSDGVANPAGTPGGDAHVAALPLGSVTSASLDVASGVTEVDITTRDLRGRLLEAATPIGSGLVPSLTTGANTIVRVDLSHVSGSGPAKLAVVLDRSVTWSVFLDGGASTERLNLRGAKANVVDLGAGVSQARITLPRATGTDLLRMTGGATRLVVGVPKGSPTRVHVKGGASTVRIGSVTHTGIGGSRTFDAAGYAAASDRIDLEIEAGVSALVVRSY
jgi:hypothetical protein